MKQMTWHKNGKRYNPDKMVHPSEGEAWICFNDKHHDKVDEARNVRVALATDGFNPYGMMAAPIHLLARNVHVSFNLEDLPEAYMNPSVHSRISEYTEVARSLHGPDHDPST